MNKPLSIRRLTEMRLGRDALRVRIGENDKMGLCQLPDPSIFVAHTGRADLAPDFCRFGSALAEAFFKLIRPSALDAKECGIDLDGIAIWEYVSRIQVDDIRFGFLAHVERLVQFALLRPGALPEINRRIDALDNATLQEHMTKALCWESVGKDEQGSEMFFGDDGGVFKGLK